MTTAYIFDTEATGLDDPELIEAARLCLRRDDDKIAPVIVANLWQSRFKPATPITYGAMAVHHILPHELDGEPPSSMFQLPDDVDYLVGHNIDFDWGVIGKPDVKRICTDAMARYVWTDADSYSQSALLYYTVGATEEMREALKGAHGALVDVENNLRLLLEILKAKPEITTWSELHAYSEACRIPRVMPIGRNQGLQGLTLEECARTDPGFCQWCLNQEWIDPYLYRGIYKAVYGVDPSESGEHDA
jgi:exodeoxyribonuclease X